MVGFLINELNCLSGRLSDYDSLSGILSFYINDSTYN